MEVHVVMTEAATRFVQPLTFAALTGHKVITSLWDESDSNEDSYESSIEHIGEAQWTEALVVAPATADILAKFAQGIANDFLTTMYLATRRASSCGSGDECKHVAASGDAGQSRHSATAWRRVIDPGTGDLACGMVGAGRMAEPEAIADVVFQSMGRRHDLAGETVLVTAGGTREALDPVRYHWQPLQRQDGVCAGRCSAESRSESILISGPSALHPPARCEMVHVTTAAEMRKAVLERMVEATMVIKAAAVADYRPVNVSEQKLKRTGPMTLELAPTEDILAEVTKQRRPGQLIVGFAAETQNTMENGRAKLLRKGADAIVVNDVSGEGVGIDSDRNAATFLTASTSIELPEMTKRKLADRIFDEISALRRPRPLVFEVDEGTPQDKVLKESVAPTTTRRQIIVE